MQFDRPKWAAAVIESRQTREIILDFLIHDPWIMIYYNSYYILQDATQLRPDLFIEFWNEFAGLLSHGNSYHRDIAVTLLANILPEDTSHKFDNIFDKYTAVVHDTKFMTGDCCIKNMIKIVRARPDLIDRIFDILIDHEKLSKYTQKQEELLKSGILQFFDSVFDDLEIGRKTAAAEFVCGCKNSSSPKTKKLATVIASARGLK